MSYGKNALKAGGVAAGGVFVICCFIPIVGGLVGLAAGAATFVVVEAGALTAYGIYATGKGIAHGVKHISHSIHESNERRREKRWERNLEKERQKAAEEVIAKADTNHHDKIVSSTPQPAYIISPGAVVTADVVTEKKIQPTATQEEAHQEENAQKTRRHKHRHRKARSAHNDAASDQVSTITSTVDASEGNVETSTATSKETAANDAVVEAPSDNTALKVSSSGYSFLAPKTSNDMTEVHTEVHEQKATATL